MNQPEIAKNLKNQRQILGWSLSKAAAETTVSKAMLGQIERGESSPTIAILWKIAKGFHLPLTAFFTEPPVQNNFSQFQDGIGFKTLFAFNATIGSEMFLMHLRANETHQSAPHDQGVVEDIVMISGSMDVLHNGKWQILETGETLRFKADQPHGYRNLSPQATTFHNIIHYPR